MLLGQKSHTAGDTIRYITDYTRWLEDGVSLVSAVVTIDPTTPRSDITISGVTLLTEHNRVAFVLAGGSLNEIFTLDIQAVDTRGEIKNDTMQFTVVAP